MIHLLSDGSNFAKLNYNINNNNIESLYYLSFVSSFNFNLLTALQTRPVIKVFREKRHVELPTYHVTNEPTIRVHGVKICAHLAFSCLKAVERAG